MKQSFGGKYQYVKEMLIYPRDGASCQGFASVTFFVFTGHWSCNHQFTLIGEHGYIIHVASEKLFQFFFCTGCVRSGL